MLMTRTIMATVFSLVIIAVPVGRTSRAETGPVDDLDTKQDKISVKYLAYDWSLNGR